ncbi:MAG: hypothetical protein ACYC2T_08300 [Bacillota bacterium]
METQDPKTRSPPAGSEKPGVIFRATIHGLPAYDRDYTGTGSRSFKGEGR